MSVIHFYTSGNVGVIEFNREEFNTIDINFSAELLEAALQCDSDKSIRSILITGRGPMFCGGGDLSAFADYGEAIGRKLTDLTWYLNKAVSCLARTDKPIVVAVNGAAAGAGFSLALLGDYVLASDRSSFTVAYTGVGLTPDVGMSFYLPRIVGLRKAQELMLLNTKVDANSAADMGIVNRVVEGSQLLEKAFAVAAKLAEGPTRSYGVIKNLLMDSFSVGLESQLEVEARAISAISNTSDARNAIDAFIHKKAARFSGN